MASAIDAGKATLVSVIIPAFNRQDSIQAAVRSVLRQTYPNIEIIIVDDCSTDETFAAASSIADPRIRGLQAPRNLGSGGARNLGVSQARGDWIAFQDSDDEWLPTKLEKQMRRMLVSESRHVGCYCGLLTVLGLDHQQGRRSVPRYTPDASIEQTEIDLVQALLEHNFISTQTLIMRRDTFDGIGGFDENFEANEDWDLALRLSLQGPLAFVDEPLVLQTFSPNSLSRDNRKLLQAQQRMLDKHGALFNAHPDVLARLYYRLAGGSRRLGDMEAARRYLVEALRLQPGNPRFLAMSGFLMMRSAMILMSATPIV